MVITLYIIRNFDVIIKSITIRLGILFYSYWIDWVPKLIVTFGRILFNAISYWRILWKP